MSTAIRTVSSAATLVATVILSVTIALDRPLGGTHTSHTVHGSDAESLAEIEQADSAFRAAGLGLPSLDIHVHESYAGCDGRSGLFNRDGSGNRVDYCSGHPFTVLHEFAHAWEYHRVDNATRDAFLELHSLSTWRSREIPWSARGTEVAAETIAQGLMERASPEWQCDEVAILDDGFRLLTGRRSPR